MSKKARLFTSKEHKSRAEVSVTRKDKPKQGARHKLTLKLAWGEGDHQESPLDSGWAGA
ncbi:MAG TPA: hypothetical protein PLE10_02935 [Brevefilum sp.]|nr:hypothetical protein [Brevefilum sp.]HOR18770.1 hypothetical protein [Brevefilum sp.]HPL68671.1 hypothetical protein [Brevefilum sp.]